MENNTFENVAEVPAKANPKKLVIIIVAIIAALAIIAGAVAIIIDASKNTYKRPLELDEKFANSKKYTDEYAELIAYTNGFCKSEVKKIASVLKSTEEYKDDLADAKENFKDSIETKEDDWGKNWRIEYDYEDKEKLEREAVRSFRDSLRSKAEILEEAVEKTEDWDSEDWADFAEDLEVSKGKAKKYVKALKSIAKKFKKAKVEEGYTITYTRRTEGSELDEAIESKDFKRVYKIDGRWVDSYTVDEINGLSANLFVAALKGENVKDMMEDAADAAEELLEEYGY